MQIATEVHRLWPLNQGQRFLDFSKNARVADGFCALDGMGEKPRKAEADGILTARMTHSFALGALLGIPGCHAMSAHGVDCLLHRLNDLEH
ncbi:MAG: AGE family epimerase/isomerase [Acetobacteraceae bacterium]